jgi:hypothetical protein
MSLRLGADILPPGLGRSVPARDYTGDILMNFKTLSILASFAVLGAGAAHAQDPRPAPSPEMQAARQAMRDACAADAKTLCDGKEGREAMMCMRDNLDKVSSPCKDAISKMMAVRRAAQPQ